MHDHRLEFGTHEHTSTSAQQQHNHKFELESVGLVLGAPAGAAPSEVQQLVARGDELEHLSQAGGGADKQAGLVPAVTARLCCSWSYRAPGLTTS